MVYLCHTKEERALDTRVLSSFLVKIPTYMACFTSDVEKNTSEINFFLGFIVNFFRQVVAFMTDVERNYSAIIALCLLVWDPHPADRLQSRIGVRVFSFVGFS